MTSGPAGCPTQGRTPLRRSNDVLATGGRSMGIVVPDDVLGAFGRGKRFPVVVTIDGGYQCRNTINTLLGRSLISFNAETRKTTRCETRSQPVVRC
jgi:hypothetical protein